MRSRAVLRPCACRFSTARAEPACSAASTRSRRSSSLPAVVWMSGPLTAPTFSRAASAIPPSVSAPRDAAVRRWSHGRGGTREREGRGGHWRREALEPVDGPRPPPAARGRRRPSPHPGPGRRLAGGARRREHGLHERRRGAPGRRRRARGVRAGGRPPGGRPRPARPLVVGAAARRPRGVRAPAALRRPRPLVVAAAARGPRRRRRPAPRVRRGRRAQVAQRRARARGRARRAVRRTHPCARSAGCSPRPSRGRTACPSRPSSASASTSTRTATSCRCPPPRRCGSPASATLDRDTVLRACLRAVAVRYRRWVEAGGDPRAGDVGAAYREACLTLGREVEVQLPGAEPLRGVAEEVDDAGRLVVARRGRWTPHAGRRRRRPRALTAACSRAPPRRRHHRPMGLPGKLLAEGERPLLVLHPHVRRLARAGARAARARAGRLVRHGGRPGRAAPAPTLRLVLAAAAVAARPAVRRPAVRRVVEHASTCSPTSGSSSGRASYAGRATTCLCAA